MICEECGSDYLDGVCPNCGLVSNNWDHIDDSVVYHEYDVEVQHGAPRTHKISNMAVMTWVDNKETDNPDLKRALERDGWFGWEVQKSMYINNEFKRLVEKFNLNYLFIDDCYYYMRKFKDKISFVGKSLDDVIPALFYLFIRLNGQPYTLLDFRRHGYDTKKIYNIYIYLIKNLNLYKKIIPQDPLKFVVKSIDHIYDFNKFYPEMFHKAKHELVQFIQEQFVGIYKRSISSGFVDISENGLSTIGAILYLAVKHEADWKLTQTEVANACDISEVTLRKYIKKLTEYYRTLERFSKNG